MKILILDLLTDVDNVGQGGLSDVAWNLATSLRALGNEAHILAPYKSDNYPDKSINVHTFNLPIVGYRNVIGHTLVMLKAWRELKKIGPIDIIQALESHSAAIFCILARDVPVVLTAPGNIYEKIRQNANPYDWFTTQVYKITTRISSKSCRHIIATSTEQKKWWEYTGASSSKITLIPNPVDSNLFKPIPNAREKLNIKKDSKVVLYAGRLSLEKGLKCLLDAIKIVKEDMQDVQLHLVGRGPEREFLSEHAKKLKIENNVFFHGYVFRERLALFYSAADVVAMPSLTEAFGRVLPEAMACKTPVIGSNVGGIPDTVKDGNTGLLSPPKDSRTLAMKIKEILENKKLAEQLAENAYDYVHRNLSKECIARRYQEEVYKPILNGKL